MKWDLDNSIEAYSDEFHYALDNRLMLTWYPRRVMLKARGTSALDLGVGFGYAMKIFSERFQRYLVIEGSAAVIENALVARDLSGIDIQHAYFETFLSDEVFDNIIMGFVLEHVADPALVLSHFRRFVAPEGRVFVAVPNGEALNRRFGKAAGLLDDLSALNEGDRLLGHQRVFTLASLRALVESQGYEIRSEEGLFLKPITTEQILRLQLSEPILNAMMSVGVDYPELSVGILMELQRND